jgi:hypothetical protein
MAHHMYEEPHSHGRMVTEKEPGDSLTSYAAVKYTFILLITIVVLYFLARFVLPLVR